MWEFPKIGEPNIVPLNSRILIIRTPQIRYPPIFGNPHVKEPSTVASRRTKFNRGAITLPHEAKPFLGSSRVTLKLYRVLGLGWYFRGTVMVASRL